MFMRESAELFAELGDMEDDDTPYALYVKILASPFSGEQSPSYSHSGQSGGSLLEEVVSLTER